MLSALTSGILDPNIGFSLAIYLKLVMMTNLVWPIKDDFAVALHDFDPLNSEYAAAPQWSGQIM